MRPQIALAACLAMAVVACGSGGSTGPLSTPTPSPSSAPADVYRGVDVPVAGQSPQTGASWYLAIGDSVTFGYTVDPARTGTNSSWPLQLQDLLAGSGRPWRLYDTACPGETTVSYFGRCPRQSHLPLLAGRSQDAAALSAIHDHTADLRAIFVALGSNDLLQARAAKLDALTALTTLRANLVKILEELKQAAPGVPIVLCNFYDPYENSDPSTVTQISLVNGALQQLATEEQVKLADFFTAINTLTPPDPDLGKYVDLAHQDIHPTVAGHARLAAAALAAIPK